MGENNFKIRATAKGQDITQSGGATFNQHKFISDIYECEKQLYILNARLRELFVKRTVGPTDFPKDFKKSIEYKNYCKEVKKKKNFPKAPESPDSDYESIFDILLGYLAMGGTIGVIGGAGLDIIIDIIKKDFVVAPGLYFAICATIVIFVIGVIKYASKKHTYKNYLNQVKEIKKENSDIVKYNNERYKYWENEYFKQKKLAREHFDENECVLIDNEADLIRECKLKTENTLDELYNLRINGVLCLHPNYQGLIPISIIYGYFDTGRCTQLQGHEGAYNLYEDEKMKKMIITKLDVVSQQLGQLNEAMIYVGQAIEECNSRLADLEDASDRMISSVNSMNSNVSNRLNSVSNQMSAIEENTANSAYYAEVGARMTAFNTAYNLLKD